MKHETNDTTRLISRKQIFVMMCEAWFRGIWTQDEGDLKFESI